MILKPPMIRLRRDKNVKDTSAKFLDHRLWEKAHAGQKWDSLKR
jgi:hypothetical protein